MLSVQLGAALAVPLMTTNGSFGITAQRLCCAALVMAVLVRPRITRFDRRQWLSALALGTCMALMTLSYFEAVTVIPIGPAVTIDFLGPLFIAAVSLTGWSRIVLPALAAFGVVAISYGRGGWLLAPTGIGFALGAACGWACYIVLARHVGRLFAKQDGLSLSFIVAALVALPLAYAVSPTEISWTRLPAAAGLALLAPLIPFTFEMMALRRIEIGVFSILMSLEPAIGAVFGLLILGQVLSLQQTMGVAAVMLASACAVYITSFRQPYRGGTSGTKNDDVVLSEVFTESPAAAKQADRAASS